MTEPKRTWFSRDVAALGLALCIATSGAMVSLPAGVITAICLAPAFIGFRQARRMWTPTGLEPTTGATLVALLASGATTAVAIAVSGLFVLVWLSSVFWLVEDEERAAPWILMIAIGSALLLGAWLGARVARTLAIRSLRLPAVADRTTTDHAAAARIAKVFE